MNGAGTAHGTGTRRMQSPSSPLFFYGDDFTGATAHLAGFHEAGLRSLLFLNTPTPGQLERHLAELDVVGVAGIARSLAPAGIEAEVRPAFELFKRYGARQVQYKVCSTFDSSPAVGSIGAAMELGRRVFGEAVIPVLPADPRLGRYTLFGHHFARAGDAVYRLDRHPSMSRHPATPMHEADLRLHLAAQTDLAGESIDVTAIRAGRAAALWERARTDGAGYVVFDALEEADLDAVVPLLWQAGEAAPLFSVASQGLAAAFGRFLAARMGGMPRRHGVPAPGGLDRMLVLSGSAAVLNGRQLRTALDAGWCGIRVDVPALLADDGLGLELARLGLAMQQALDRGRSTVLYTASGPDDPALAGVRALQASRGLSAEAVSEAIGALFAGLADRAVTACGLRRLVLAGGDTSSHAMRRLDAYALEIAAAGRHGGRLCRLLSFRADMQGLEVMLKGGQVGNDDSFVQAASAGVWMAQP